MSRNNKVLKDSEELPSNDLTSDHAHPDDVSNAIDLQNNHPHSRFSQHTINSSNTVERSVLSQNIPSNNFFLETHNTLPMIQPNQNNSFTRTQQNQYNSVLNHYQNSSASSPPLGQSLVSMSNNVPTQRLLYDTNQFVTVSGSFEEPMDETVENEQTFGDMRVENGFLNLREERIRLHTYENWPHDMPMQINPSKLAQNGFYYLGPYDRVRCIFCAGILKKWSINDDVQTEHQKHFPNCPFVQGFDVGNIPLGGIVMPKMGQVMSKSNSFGVLSKVNEPSNETPSERAENLGIVQNKPKHPQFSFETDRLATFKNWPSQIKQQPEDLAKAGLFYIGDGDKVKCFTCDGLLCQWEPDDNPWIEHARWFPDCQFVRLVKGDAYIAHTLRQETPIEIEKKSHSEKEQEQNSASVQALLEDGYSVKDVSEAIKCLHENGDIPHDKIPPAQIILAVILEKEQKSSVYGINDQLKKENDHKPNEKSVGDGHKESDEDISALLEENRELKEQKICKICLDNEISIIFLPCGHLVCCGTCASSVSDCPICRGPIKGTAKAFWS